MNGNKKLKSNNISRVSLKDTLINNIKDNLLICIVILSIIIFIFWPVVAVIKESLVVNGTFSLDVYISLISENKKLLYNSISVAMLTTIISIIIALCISIFIVYSGSKLRKIIFSLLLVTMIAPPFVTSLAFIVLFGKRGLITHKLLKLSINPYGFQGIVVMEVVGFVALAALLIISTLRNIDKNLICASKDLGANDFDTFMKVVLPMAKPGIIVATLITFVRSLSDFGTPLIVGGNYGVLASEAYINVIANSDLSKASAMSVLLLLPSLIIFIFYKYVMKDLKFYSYQSSKEEKDYKLYFPKYFKIFICIITYSFIFITILQYIAIFVAAFVNFRQTQIRFTFEQFLLMDEPKIKSVIRSICYSLISGIVGGLIGILFAYTVERKNTKLLKVLDFIATLPYMIPGTLFGIGYLLAFNDYPLALTGTSAIVVLNCIFKQLPISTKAGSAVVSKLNPEIEYSAKDLGASEFYVVKDIILPLLKPAFLVSFINIFTSTMTSIGALIFLISPSSKVATVEMFGAIRDGDLSLGAVFAVIMILVTLAINLLFIYLIQREEKDNVSKS